MCSSLRATVARHRGNTTLANEQFEEVLGFWFSSRPSGDHAAMVRQWSGGFAVVRT